MSLTHLSTGSECPPLQPGKIRIYAMRFCPYAQRALLVAAAKNLPHDVVYIDLTNKPKWIFEKNSGGKVPTVQTEDGVITESLIIADYLDEASLASPQLHPKDAFRKAEDRIWVENFGKLDAKKSPLALLAQTCSQIGADPPSTKSLLPSLSNSSSSSSSSSTSSQSHSTSNTGNSHHHSSSTSSSDSVNGNRNSSTTPNSSERLPKKSHNRKQSNSASPNSLKSVSSASPNSSSLNNNNLTSTTLSSASSKENVTIVEDDSKTLQRSKTPVSKGGSPVSGTTSPNISSSAPGPGKQSPSAQSISMSLSSSSSSSTSSNYLPETTSSSVSRSSTFETSSLSTSSISTAAVSSGSNMNISSSKLNLTGPDLSPLGSLKHSASVTSSLVPFPGLYPGLPPPSLSSAAGQGIPPYLHSYARLKAAAAAGGSDPLAALTSPLSSLGGGGPSGGCRDPFCTGCQLGSGHLSGGSSGGKCPAGCSQCDHHKSPLGALGSGAFNGFPFFPGFPSLPPSLAGLSAAYGSPSSHGSSGLQSSQSLAVTPYVCNWVGGPDNYCGKRFSSSDELFQHLRSHTSLSSAGSQAASDCAALMERYSQAAASTHPLLSSAAAAAHINRTYPTPPLSPLSSARFHPYSKPGAGMSLSSLGLQTNPSAAASLAATFPPPGFSALAHPLSPYYPYSFYGQRLGASGSLHP